MIKQRKHFHSTAPQKFLLIQERKCLARLNLSRCVTGTYKIKIEAYHPNWMSYKVAHEPTIKVQNNCNSASVGVTFQLGWLKFNNVNYSEDMVVAYVSDITYDYTKLTLTDSACQKMTENQKLALFIGA